MKLIKILLLALTFSAWAVEREDHALLLTDVVTFDQRYLALTIKHEEKWHTYWKNPGDAGITTKYKFEQNGKEITIESFEWPAPHRYLETGDILTYGYEGDPTFFFKLPSSLKGPLSISAQWLICKDICLPGGKNAEVILSDSPIVKTARSGMSDGELKTRFENLPQVAPWPSELEFYASKSGDKALRFDYIVKGATPQQYDKSRNLLTPFLAPPVGFRREEVRFDEKEKALVAKLPGEWDGEYQDPPYPLPTNGVFLPPIKVKFLYQAQSGKTLVIEKELNTFSTTSTGLDEMFNRLSPLDGKVAANTSETSLWLALLLAFLGGLILNLMPCVLPVISIKLFGMIKYQSLPRARVLQHNLAYSAGVLATFWLLALAVVVIKSSGEAIGWGFQLQSPLFVLAMLAILFIMALNLFGLFEFRTPGGSALGNAQVKDGFTGDFFSGVLSTILSTPCSAPFLGSALTFAFTGSNAMIFLVLSFVGIGLAFPFLLTAIFPALISFLPKPGAWMEKLKYFLGLSMLVTVAWLADVFLNLVDPAVWSWPLSLFFISLFFAFFFKAKISKNLGLVALMFLLPLALILGALKNFPLRPADRMNQTMSSSNWQPWSPQMMESLKGQWVFMDFTAAWCLTCKVNKKLVLDTEEFKLLAQEHKVQLLRGDWTQRDDTITKFLQSYNIFGVPAYFLQKPDGSVLSLGETISVGKVREQLTAPQ